MFRRQGHGDCPSRQYNSPSTTLKPAKPESPHSRPESCNTRSCVGAVGRPLACGDTWAQGQGWATRSSSHSRF